MSNVMSGEVLSQRRAMRNSAPIEKPIITFAGEGLIPRPDLYWAVQDGGRSYFNPKENIRVGKVFDFVEDLTAENVFLARKSKIIPKPIMAYELSRDKTEREILISANKLGLTRYKEEFFGKVTFFDHPDFYSMKNEREMEVNLFDFYQIALRHKLPKEFLGKKLPANKNIHLFLELPVPGQNKFERVLKTYHILLRNKEDISLSATAHAFIPDHTWSEGDLCIFMIHKNFVPNVDNI